MSNQSPHPDESRGSVRVVPDFLPPPEELAYREDSVKVTILLTTRSVNFFKQEAARTGTQYQGMIRRLVDAYAQMYASRDVRKKGPRPRRKAK